MIENQLTPIDVTRYSHGRFHNETAHVALEATLAVEVNGQVAAPLLCSPFHVEALVQGALFSAGVIRCSKDIESLCVDERQHTVRVRVKEVSGLENFAKPAPGFGSHGPHESCDRHPDHFPIASHSGVDPERLIKIMEWLMTCSALHRQTGGVHSAAVSIANAMPQFHIDDIGRHNAVDKVIGTLLMQEVLPDNMVLLETGRISCEVLHKAARFGIPVLASRGAPTRESVLKARQLGITVVGFARSDRFTLFSHPGRVLNF